MFFQIYGSRLFAAIVLLAWFSSANALVLQVDSAGLLTGATDVSVAGSLYDVQFSDGSCNSLFGGCDPTTFNFHNANDAAAAATALMNSVFTDSAAGQFDSNPENTRGCSLALITCEIVIPYEEIPNPVVTTFRLAVFRNLITEIDDQVRTDYQNYDSFDMTGLPAVWALWSPVASSADGTNGTPGDVSAVPEPATVVLLVVGLVGLGFSDRRKTKVSMA